MSAPELETLPALTTGPVCPCVPVLAHCRHTWNAEDISGAWMSVWHQARRFTCSPFTSPSKQLWVLFIFKRVGKSRLQSLLIIWLCSVPAWADTSLPWFPPAYPRELALPELFPSKLDFKYDVVPLNTGPWISLRPFKFFPSLNTQNKSHKSRDYLQQWPTTFSTWEKKQKPGWVFTIHLLNEWNIRKIWAMGTANLENSTSSRGPKLCP